LSCIINFIESYNNFSILSLINELTTKQETAKKAKAIGEKTNHSGKLIKTSNTQTVTEIITITSNTQTVTEIITIIKA
jgi:hypothetical protein